MGGYEQRVWGLGLGLLLALACTQAPASAFELRGGVGLGVIVAGSDPRVSVSPHAGIFSRTEAGFSFGAESLFSIVPATNSDGIGIYNQSSLAVGYAFENSHFSLGPALSFYSIATCSGDWCGRVTGTAPGAHAQASFYFAGPLGVSVGANVDWIGGESLLLRNVVAATILAGPVLRWRSK